MSRPSVLQWSSAYPHHGHHHAHVHTHYRQQPQHQQHQHSHSHSHPHYAQTIQSRGFGSGIGSMSMGGAGSLGGSLGGLGPQGGHGVVGGVGANGSPLYPSLPMHRAPDLPASTGYPHSAHHSAHSAQQRTPTRLLSNMSGNAYMPSDEELAQMQKLSNDFEPEVDEGPGVGERQSTTVLIQEYANADPVYQTKTSNLPNKFPFFRKVRGDGHCGWRAIAFAYLEALLSVGDVTKFELEEVRFKSMQNLHNTAGHPQDIIEDFADAVFDLLKALANAVSKMDGSGPGILHQSFNDYSISMGIITYFKLLASAWIQVHPNDYIPFISGYPDLKSYCTDNIEKANCEIDHVGAAALADVVVKPAGFGIDIMYLDRSAVDEVNHTLKIEPSDPTAPTLWLLYRPGHYDILYKANTFPTVPQQAPLQVALLDYTDEFVPMASNTNDVMTMIPGLYGSGMGEQRWSSTSYDYDTNPAPPAYAPVPTPSIAPVASSPSTMVDYVSPVRASHVSHHSPANHQSIQLEPPVTLPVTLPIHSLSQPPPTAVGQRGMPMIVERGEPFRPSRYMPGFRSCQTHSLPFQTTPFRNSLFNTAHYLNPDFQPEEWSPEAEYAGANRGRHKST